MGFWNRFFWNNTLLNWAVSLGEFLLLYTLLELIRVFLLKRLRKLAAKTKTKVDDLIVQELERTRHTLFLLVSLHVASLSLTLPPRLSRLLLSLTALIIFFQVGLWATTAIRFWLERYKEEKLREDAAAVTTMGALAFLGKLAVWTVLLLLALDNLGVNVTGLIAGMGIGGIAVALAAQNILGDLFASLSIVLDKPFIIGDSIAFDGLQGRVEHVGLKTTRLRSLSGEELVVANSDLLKCRISNYRNMRERRVLLTLGVSYDTPTEKVERLPQMISDLLRGPERLRFERAHFKGFGPSALEFEVVYWVTEPDFGLFMDLQQWVALTLLKALRSEGIDTAFPTRTIHLHSPSREESQGREER